MLYKVLTISETMPVPKNSGQVISTVEQECGLGEMC